MKTVNPFPDIGSDVLIDHVTITAKRNGKGKLKASWVIKLSNGETKELVKGYKNLGELRKEMMELKQCCIDRGMEPDQFTMQNFYN